MADQGANRRQHERKDASFNAEITLGEERRGCTILDISPGGARLKPLDGTEKGQEGTLHLGKLGDFPVTVAWCREGATGVQFQMPPDEVVNVVMAIAMHGTD